jgi:trk system potassium uptake protein TrkA
MRVVIVGVGETGLELANNLIRKGDSELVLIDVDEARCDRLAGELDALVLHGDGSDPDILRKAELSEADALIASTGTDAVNALIAMLGRQMAVDKIIVKLNNVGLRPACQEIGVSRIVMPKISAAAEMISTLYGFDRINFSIVASGGLRLDLLQAKGSVGEPLTEVELPEGAHIVAVLRGQEMLLPRQNLKLQEDDELLVLTEDEAVLKEVEAILSQED